MIQEDDVFTALERLQSDKAMAGDSSGTIMDDGVVSPIIKRTLATYLCAKALIGVLTPGYDDLQKVTISPRSTLTGSVYFIPQDAHLETDITTRSFMEAHISVRARACACAGLRAWCAARGVMGSRACRCCWRGAWRRRRCSARATCRRRALQTSCTPTTWRER